LDGGFCKLAGRAVDGCYDTDTTRVALKNTPLRLAQRSSYPDNLYRVSSIRHPDDDYAYDTPRSGTAKFVALQIAPIRLVLLKCSASPRKSSQTRVQVWLPFRLVLIHANAVEDIGKYFLDAKCVVHGWGCRRDGGSVLSSRMLKLK